MLPYNYINPLFTIQTLRKGGESLAKYCAVCGKKLGLIEGKTAMADGMVCTPCWSGAGQGMRTRSILTVVNKTSDQLRDLIEIEILQRQIAKIALQECVTSSGVTDMPDKIRQNTATGKDVPAETVTESSNHNQMPEFCSIDIII